ncbi:hypothetical protein ACFVRU_20365, partial [Streptomyces sp. NPDC057927]
MSGGADRFEPFDEPFDRPLDEHEEHEAKEEHEEHGSKEQGGEGDGEDGGGRAQGAADRSSGGPLDVDGGHGDGPAGGGGDGGGGGFTGPAGPAGSGQPPRIPLPRSSVEDTGLPLPEPAPLFLEHRVLKSLLGAWALAACSAQET